MASWEVQNVEQKSTMLMETQDVVGHLASGNLGIFAKVRQAGESQWMAISQAPDFYALCPFVNPQYVSNSKIFSIGGNVTINNDIQKFMSASAGLRAI